MCQIGSYKDQRHFYKKQCTIFSLVKANNMIKNNVFHILTHHQQKPFVRKNFQNTLYATSTKKMHFAMTN